MSNEIQKTEVSKALVPVDLTGNALAVTAVVDQVEMIFDCMKAKKRDGSSLLKNGTHYGTIPGCPKPTLFQAGADILNLMFRLRPEFEVVSAARQDSFIAYTVRCNLFHTTTNQLVATGLGNCNTREVKYQKNIQSRGCSPWELDNTIMKMAAKRAKIAATLNGTGAAEVFTQDVGDDEEPGGTYRQASPSPRKSAPYQAAKKQVEQMRQPGEDEAEDMFNKSKDAMGGQEIRE